MSNNWEFHSLSLCKCITHTVHSYSTYHLPHSFINYFPLLTLMIKTMNLKNQHFFNHGLLNKPAEQYQLPFAQLFATGWLFKSVMVSFRVSHSKTNIFQTKFQWSSKVLKTRQSRNIFSVRGRWHRSQDLHTSPAHLLRWDEFTDSSSNGCFKPDPRIASNFQPGPFVIFQSIAHIVQTASYVHLSTNGHIGLEMKCYQGHCWGLSWGREFNSNPVFHCDV